MSFILNQGQQKVVDAAYNWYKKDHNKQVFQYSGNAGTGKSVVLKAIIDRLKIPQSKIAPMSFIGAAAIVMRLKGLHNAKTIHSWLYSPTQVLSTDKDGNTITNSYFDRPKFNIGFTPKPLNGIELIIIDEAGMVPYNLKEEIERRGIKIIACGDLDQLPPVGDRPAYLYDGDVYILDQLMRQSKDSNIVNLAQRAKQGLPIHKGFYGDVLVIDEGELTNDMILSSDIIICGKNKTRDIMNNRIRDELLKINSILPTCGEKVVCRKNNWKLEHDGINLANGLRGSVSNFPDVGSFDGKNFMIDFQPDMLDSSFKDISCDYEYFSSPYNMKDKLKYSKYNNGEKFEFAYCITTHMSQGSQYANGIYMEEYLNSNINANLNYTGITRFSNFVIYVKQKRKYF